jgi:hypothetical protein
MTFRDRFILHCVLVMAPLGAVCRAVLPRRSHVLPRHLIHSEQRVLSPSAGVEAWAMEQPHRWGQSNRT